MRLAYLICVLIVSIKVVGAEPFQLPLYSQSDSSGDVSIAPLFDMDGVLLKMIRCLPKKSKFKLELDVVTRVGSNGGVFDSNVGQLGRYYIGIVGKMPLYSAAEVDRSLKWESEIRLKISQLIGSIANNVVRVRTALREMGLYLALERRAQRRIKAGIAFTEEQVKYLEKVISSRKMRNEAIAAINVSRLELVALCRSGRREQVSRDLVNIIERALR